MLAAEEEMREATQQHRNGTAGVLAGQREEDKKELSWLHDQLTKMELDTANARAERRATATALEELQAASAKLELSLGEKDAAIASLLSQRQADREASNATEKELHAQLDSSRGECRDTLVCPYMVLMY